MATANYQAGVESTNVEMSFGREANWGVKPAVAFQALRMRSEGFAEQKSRSRPGEIRTDAQAAASVTQSISASGTLDFAWHYGTYDAIVESLMMGPWGSSVTINGAAGDIAFVATGNKITSTTHGKFTDVTKGMWLDVQGCSLNPSFNPGRRMFLRVETKTNDQELAVVGVTLVDETPAGAEVKIRNGGMVRNNAEFHSFYVQKKFAPDKYLLYPGSWVTGGSLNGEQGQFMQGSFQFSSKSQEKATVNASTGDVLPAPTGRVIDTVAGMQQILMNGSPIDAVVQGFNWTVQHEGAQGIYGIGSAHAQGGLLGAFTATGTIKMVFRNFDVYSAYQQEQQALLSYASIDNIGAGYMVTIPAAVLNNPKIVASGPNQPVLAEFSIEADPHAATGTTMQFDRFAAPV